VNYNDEILEMFCNSFRDIMSTEASMEEYWKTKFPITFSRTDHGKDLVWSLFSAIHYQVKKERATSYDGVVLAKALALSDKLDYNLCSQAILNLQAPPQFMFDLDLVRHDIMDVSDKAVDAGAPDPKVKGKISKLEESWVPLYNQAVNAVAIEKIASSFSNNISWRLSGISQTPSMTDSQNLSMLRHDAVKYMKLLHPHHKMVQLTWPDSSVPVTVNSDGNSYVPGIKTSFFSKSGGEILGKALLARKMMVWAYAFSEVINVFPRLNSIIVIANDQFKSDAEFSEEFMSVFEQSCKG
jgi:hypothetical protein